MRSQDRTPNVSFMLFQYIEDIKNVRLHIFLEES